MLGYNSKYSLANKLGFIQVRDLFPILGVILTSRGVNNKSEDSIFCKMLKLDFCLVLIIVRMYFTFLLDVTLISGGLSIPSATSYFIR